MNDKRHHHHHKGKSSESLLDKAVILESLKINPGEVILDAGCGNGYMAREFAWLVRPTGIVYALDPDAELIDKLKEEAQGTAIKPLVGDITKQTPLPDTRFDLIYVSMVLHGFAPEQMDGFIKEVKRIIKPEGRLAIVEFKKTETPSGPPLEIRYAPEELKQRIDLTPGGLVDVNESAYMQLFMAS